jgi:hypothetical protein
MALFGIRDGRDGRGLKVARLVGVRNTGNPMRGLDVM